MSTYGQVVPPSLGGALAAGAMVVLAAVELIPEAFSHSYVGEAPADEIEARLADLRDEVRRVESELSKLRRREDAVAEGP